MQETNLSIKLKNVVIYLYILIRKLINWAFFDMLTESNILIYPKPKIYNNTYKRIRQVLDVGIFLCINMLIFIIV
jgi:hypothetical protein